MIEGQKDTPDEVVIGLTTFPDEPTARQIGTIWVDSQLAACVNLLPGVSSIYRWEGKTECAAEVVAVVKTTRAALPALEASLRRHHPYELPEWLLLPVAGGSQGYLAWVRHQTTLDKAAS